MSYPHLIIENPLSIRKLFVCGIPVSLMRMPGAYTLLVLTGGPLSSRHSNITQPQNGALNTSERESVVRKKGVKNDCKKDIYRSSLVMMEDTFFPSTL